MKTRTEPAEAHNEESLDRLLAHVESESRSRCDKLAAEAREKASTIRRQARQRAADLLRETRRRERRNAHERVRTERARQESRVRQRRLAERLELAGLGIERVRDKLAELWRQEDARIRWLQRALADAGRVLPGGRWRVRHPEGWAADAAAAAAAGQAAPETTLEWHADAALDAGFVVEAGRAVVDATPRGLTARDERIAGVLLAELPADTAEEST